MNQQTALALAFSLVDGGLWASWTAAVRYAREWHANIYGMGGRLG